ncbi:hypothetical protein C5S30_07785, partial [ANME-1 cluster archaeon GoMg4]|nr:hypothetical protein [ANME-1 cluster archaeon GoMg4]
MGDQKAKAAANAELTVNEKKVLLALDSEKGESWDSRTLSEKTGLNEDAAMQSAFMLAHKGLCEIKEEKKVYYHLTEEGKEYAEDGLPEKKALFFLVDHKGATVEAFKKSFTDEKESNIATNWLLRKGWARFEEQDGEKVLTPTGNTSWVPLEVPRDKYPNLDVHEEFLQ